jgi:hypothetical protein
MFNKPTSEAGLLVKFSSLDEALGVTKLTNVREQGAYPRVGHLKPASLGQTPALSKNRLSRKGPPRTNTLAYFKHS